METLVYIGWIVFVIGFIIGAFYWLFSKAKKKAEQIVEEETVSDYVPAAPTVVSAPRPTVRLNNTPRTSNQNRAEQRRRSVTVSNKSVSERELRRSDDWDYANQTRVIDEIIYVTPDSHERNVVHGGGGNFGGAGASGNWEDDAVSRVTAQIVGSAIGGAIGTYVSERASERTYEEPSRSYSSSSSDSYGSHSSYDSSSSSSSDSYGSSDW